MINIRETEQLMRQDKQKYERKGHRDHTDFMMTGIAKMLDKSYYINYEINIEKLNNEIIINAKKLGLFVNDGDLYKDLLLLEKFPRDWEDVARAAALEAAAKEAAAKEEAAKEEAAKEEAAKEEAAKEEAAKEEAAKEAAANRAAANRAADKAVRAQVLAWLAKRQQVSN
jgi:hypothetical protein